MALGGVAGPEPQRLHRHHAVAVQRHQAVRRAHKMHAGPAGLFAVGFELVAHDFGDGQLGDGFIERLLQTGGQVHAGHHAVVEQRFGLAVGRTLQAGHGRGVGPQRPQALEQRGRGLAVRVQAHAHWHEFLRNGLVGRARGHGGHVRSQSARRGEGCQGRVGSRQTLGLELFK
ncbi:hypothetical protein FQZ97_842440 [compost metagenome]